MINWKVRLKNKTFWLTFIPACILLIQGIASIFGINLDLNEMQENIINVVDSLFVILALTGVIVDPTTEGLQDSVLARTYTEPKKKGY